MNGLDFGTLGYGIVGLFVLTWAVSYGDLEGGPRRGALGVHARQGRVNPTLGARAGYSVAA